jgi:hypothetical protein
MLARNGEPVHEVWLLDPLVTAQAHEAMERASFHDVWVPAMTLPSDYRLLMAFETEQTAVMVYHDPTTALPEYPLPPLPEGATWSAPVPLNMAPFVRWHGEWYETPTLANSCLGRWQYPGGGLISLLWYRQWATTSTVSRKHHYAELDDRHQTRSTSHREVPGIIVVRYRRPEATAHGHRGPVNYSHRWTVTGHLRHRRTGRVEYVRGYVKGPSGLPVIEKVRVNVLVR